MVQDNTPSRTELSSLGEFGLIRHLAEHVKLKNPSTVKGIGDDAAVLDPGGKQVVVSTDVLAEGIHFDLSYVPLKHLGYKAVVVNLSDIYAMNAAPAQILVSIALSSRFSLEAVEELYAGMLLACESYGVDLVGGDTSSSQAGLIVSITAIGYADKGEPVYRSGAQETDLICVSGDLGAAYIGLQILEREKRIFKENPNIQPDLSGSDYVLERQLKPEARRDVVAALKEAGVRPTAMIDVSDGLASEVLHLCTESKRGAVIYEDKLPIDVATAQRAEEFQINPTVCALNGGEDYELLFTVKLSDHDRVKALRDISVIGHMVSDSEGVNLSLKGTKMLSPLRAQGWDAFKK